MEYLNKTSREYFIPISLFLLIIILTLVQSPLAPFASGPFDVDSGIFLYVGSMMANGSLPYIDAWDNKGPVLYLMNMIGVIINYNHGVWFIELFSLLTSAVFMYKLFRFFASQIVSIITVIYILNVIGGLLVGGNYSEEFALPFSFTALYFFVKYIVQSFEFKNYQSVLVGSTFAATMLLRPNIATIWPAFCIIIFIDMLLQKKFSDATRFSAFFTLGVMLALLPFIYYFVANNIFSEFINAVLTIPMGMEKPALLSRLLGLSKLLWRLNLSGEILIVMLVYVIGSIRKYSASKGHKLLFRAILTAFLMNTYANSLSGNYYYHYAISFVPILSLPALFVVQWSIDWLRAKYPYNTYNSSLIYVAFFTITVVIPSFSTQLWQGIHNFNAQESDPLKQYIVAHTACEDKIQVYTRRTDLYYITRRQAASKYSYFLGNGAFDDKFEKVMLETMFNDVMVQKPQVIIAYKPDEEFLNQFKTNNRYEYENFLRANYVLNTTVNYDYLIYQRNL